MFCPQTFGSAIEKDDHTLEHFAQETCSECDRNLIRIGSKLYTLHSKETCIETKYAIQHHTDATVKAEPFIGVEVSDEFEMQNSEFNTLDQPSEPVTAQDFDNAEKMHFKIEPDNDQDQHESQMKIEKQFISVNDTESQDPHDDTFVASDVLCLDDLSTEYNSIESPSQNQFCDDPMKDDTKKSYRNREKCDVCGKTYYTGTLKRHKIR